MCGESPEDPKAATKAAEAQTRAARPNINTPFGRQTWTEEDGNWTMNAGMDPRLQGLLDRPPVDWSSLGTLGTGDDARRAAESASYYEQMQQLQPQFQDQSEALDQKLANQGLSPDSAAAQSLRHNLETSKNQAYGMARRASVGEGLKAGNQMFQNNLQSRQQAIIEMLRNRQMPWDEAQAAMGLMGFPSFNQGGDLLGAARTEADISADKKARNDRQMTEAMNMLALMFRYGAGGA